MIYRYRYSCSDIALQPGQGAPVIVFAESRDEADQKVVEAYGGIPRYVWLENIREVCCVGRCSGTDTEAGSSSVDGD